MKPKPKLNLFFYFPQHRYSIPWNVIEKVHFYRVPLIMKRRMTIKLFDGTCIENFGGLFTLDLKMRLDSFQLREDFEFALFLHHPEIPITQSRWESYFSLDYLHDMTNGH